MIVSENNQVSGGQSARYASVEGLRSGGSAGWFRLPGGLPHEHIAKRIMSARLLIPLLFVMIQVSAVQNDLSASVGVTVVTVGDSTVSSYGEDNIRRGWGQVLGDYLPPAVEVINLASSGASTKTFVELGRWSKALAVKPEFILIQFGHNDAHAKGNPKATDANTDYMDNLRRFVREARAIGATPILVTPMHRLLFNAKTGKLTGELQPYATAMGRVAAETGTPLIDLYTLSEETFEPLGNDGVAGLTISDEDRTHFTDKGARMLARLVAREAGNIDRRLKMNSPSGPRDGR